MCEVRQVRQATDTPTPTATCRTQEADSARRTAAASAAEAAAAEDGGAGGGGPKDDFAAQLEELAALPETQRAAGVLRMLQQEPERLRVLGGEAPVDVAVVAGCPPGGCGSCVVCGLQKE